VNFPLNGILVPQTVYTASIAGVPVVGTITVPVGATIIWENDDDIPHNVVATHGEFRSSALDTDDKFSVTFNKAGTFDYFCSLHSFMKGQVVVTP